MGNFLATPPSSGGNAGGGAQLTATGMKVLNVYTSIALEAERATPLQNAQLDLEDMMTLPAASAPAGKPLGHLKLSGRKVRSKGIA